MNTNLRKCSFLKQRLNHTAFTLVGTDFSTVICKGTDVVDRLDSLVKGVVAKDRQVTCRLFIFFLPFVKTFWNVTTHEEGE